jgi:NMD protein affecting ribosome stability and mRNA decay
MTEPRTRRCRECGEGTIRSLEKAGRRMAFRNMAAVPVPATLAIPTCDHCGNEWIDPRTAALLDEALESAYADELHKRLEAALEAILSTAGISQRRLEHLLGPSTGYLSRVRGRRGDASPQLVSVLALIAQDPKRPVKELDHVWQPAQA